MSTEPGYLAGQAWQLAAALLTGGALGCAYAGYERWLRRRGRPLRRRLWLWDGCFLLLELLLLLLLWLLLTDGSLRPAVFLWLAFGALAGWRLTRAPQGRPRRKPAARRQPRPARPAAGQGRALRCFTGAAHGWLLWQRSCRARLRTPASAPEEKIDFNDL